MRDGSDGPDLVFVEGGTFRIGSPTTENGRVARHEQQREVTVGDFWMTRHPITVQDYRAFLDATRYRTAAEGGSGHSLTVTCNAKLPNPEPWRS
jgi:formylglycine-generating enzyme required for sulfatase activity